MSEMILKTLGERLKILRLEQGGTQKTMAELLGCTISNYQKMEYGQVNLSTLTLCTLADYFGVTTEYLLGRSENRG